MKKDDFMTKQEMNSYRLTSMEEPTDEQLTTLMKEVAQEAKQKSEDAHRAFFKQMNEEIRKQKKIWAEKYNINFGNA